MSVLARLLVNSRTKHASVRGWPSKFLGTGNIKSLGPGGSGGIASSGDVEIGSGYNISIANSDPLIHSVTVTMSWLVTVNRSIGISGGATFGGDVFGVEVSGSATTNAGISVTKSASITLLLENIEQPD